MPSDARERSREGALLRPPAPADPGVSPFVIKHMPCQNTLLNKLPIKDREHLLAHCADVELECGDVLYEDGEALRYAYFPVSGMVSLLGRFDGGTLLEVGVIGREGMVGRAAGARYHG